MEYHILNHRMNEVLVGQEGTLCHMDDILIFGSCRQEHDTHLKFTLDTHLKFTLEHIEAVGLTLNPDKCVSLNGTLHFLDTPLTGTISHPIRQRLPLYKTWQPLLPSQN